jgi:hypothetical protein
MENNRTIINLSYRDLIGDPIQVIALLKSNLDKWENEWHYNYDDSNIGLKNIQIGDTNTSHYYSNETPMADIIQERLSQWSNDDSFEPYDSKNFTNNSYFNYVMYNELLNNYTNLKTEKLEMIKVISESKASIQDIINAFPELNPSTQETTNQVS